MMCTVHQVWHNSTQAKRDLEALYTPGILYFIWIDDSETQVLRHSGDLTGKSTLHYSR